MLIINKHESWGFVSLLEGTSMEFTTSVKFSLGFFQPFQWTCKGVGSCRVPSPASGEGGGLDLLKESL